MSSLAHCGGLRSGSVVLAERSSPKGVSQERPVLETGGLRDEVPVADWAYFHCRVRGVAARIRHLEPARAAGHDAKGIYHGDRGQDSAYLAEFLLAKGWRPRDQAQRVFARNDERFGRLCRVPVSFEAPGYVGNADALPTACPPGGVLIQGLSGKIRPCRTMHATLWSHPGSADPRDAVSRSADVPQR